MCSKHLYYEILANHYQDTVICHIDTRTVVSSHQLYTFQPIKQIPDTHQTLTKHLSKSVYMATRHYMSYLGTKNRLLNIFHILGFSSARNLVRIPSRKKSLYGVWRDGPECALFLQRLGTYLWGWYTFPPEKMMF